MKVEVIPHPKTGANELYIDGIICGMVEQVSLDGESYSFMPTCPHERLTGDHYIAIGKQLNKMNN